MGAPDLLCDGDASDLDSLPGECSHEQLPGQVALRLQLAAAQAVWVCDSTTTSQIHLADQGNGSPSQLLLILKGPRSLGGHLQHQSRLGLSHVCSCLEDCVSTLFVLTMPVRENNC